MRSEDETPATPTGDIAMQEIPGGFEIRYSARIERDHPDLVDQSADYLEDELGVLNLGQIDQTTLIADGPLTARVRDALIAWWQERIDDLHVDGAPP